MRGKHNQLQKIAIFTETSGCKVLSPIGMFGLHIPTNQIFENIQMLDRISLHIARCLETGYKTKPRID
jgi:hypothetical protein